MKSGMKILGAVAVGAALGTLAGILIAPRSGKETRKLINDKSGDMKDSLSKTVDSVLEEVKSSYAALASNVADKGEKFKNNAVENSEKIKSSIN